MKRILSSLLLAVAAVSMTTTAVAETPEEKGLAIAKEAKARNTGWGDSQADMTMILRDKGGNEAERIVKVKSLEVKGDGDKGLSVFEQPRDVEGTAFLTYSHIEGNDDQWLFLPALKRVKRISSSNKSGPWMGSEFAYEDLSSFEVEKYDYKFLRDDELNGEKMFVVEMVPTYNNSGYSKTIAWIDQEHYRVHRIEFFDQKNDKLKELNMSEFKQYLDKYWRAHRQEMENVQTGKSTTIIWKDYEFNVGLTEDDFNKSSLKRAR
ncbi:outer membrane lipoprotein-sorting protein [Kangiella aquimarina]|uniref:Outer membrane lipoprotein-sorting protein n=1 Tax=Kangiella aquimarina TaxID=261965 RepID=A0ABZ0X533_9GAMM|nr:outer membrane lipoprotein-sorting protein [Kangiella aquimarina]WQG85715.1 outer membrane lipoprotein-sorting protein [Kangiella aquimarina]